MMETVKRSELSSIKMAVVNEKKYPRVILDGNVHNWVGFGWVDEGKATDEDLEKYPEVED